MGADARPGQPFAATGARVLSVLLALVLLPAAAAQAALSSSMFRFLFIENRPKHSARRI